MIQSSTKEIIFNPKTVTEANRLRRYLNQLNEADRTGETEEYTQWTNEKGKQCYLLDSKKIDFSKSTSGRTHYIRTWDFLVQGEKPNTFQLHSLQVDYHQQYIIDGPEKEQWIKQQLKENPGTTDEDWRYMGICRSELDKCAIYNGTQHYYDATYFNQSMHGQPLSSLSFIGDLYQQLKCEMAFDPIRNMFFEHVVPQKDQMRINSLRQPQTFANRHRQEGR